MGGTLSRRNPEYPRSTAAEKRAVRGESWYTETLKERFQLDVLRGSIGAPKNARTLLELVEWADANGLELHVAVTPKKKPRKRRR